MLILQPATVTFGDEKLEQVSMVRVDRAAKKTVTEWDDSGPHVRLCDCPQIETRVHVSVPLFRGDFGSLALGTQAVLRVTTGENASDAGRRVMRVHQAVLVGVKHEVGRARGQTIATRELEFVCVSENGSDPVQVFDAGAL